MAEHFNQLSPAEAERIALLMEEAGEVVQICGKILRHGFESYHPDDEKRITNRKLLEKELGDLSAARRLMEVNGDIKHLEVMLGESSKLNRINAYLHHNSIE